MAVSLTSAQVFPPASFTINSRSGMPFSQNEHPSSSSLLVSAGGVTVVSSSAIPVGAASLSAGGVDSTPTSSSSFVSLSLFVSSDTVVVTGVAPVVETNSSSTPASLSASASASSSPSDPSSGADGAYVGLCLFFNFRKLDRPSLFLLEDINEAVPTPLFPSRLAAAAAVESTASSKKVSRDFIIMWGFVIMDAQGCRSQACK
mmetsp:Transcript_10477/g.15891  ORF Transcript_10477/g.15891 Transcript_10477/m.15891 type:complete len:203 (+) Transcript_10477:1235-1843(+)